MNLEIQKVVDRAVGLPVLAALKPVVLLLGALLRRDHDLAPRGRILVVKMLGGGSLAIALPALLGLRRARPGLPLTLLTTAGIAPFARSLAVFDEIVTVDTRGPARLAKSAARAWARAVGADTVVDLEVYSKLTTVFSVLTGARNRLGFYLESVVWRKPMQTHLVFFNRSAPAHLFYERMASLLDASPASHDDCRAHVQAHLGLDPAGRGDDGQVAIGTGCSTLSRERMLDAGQWMEVFRRRLGERPALAQATFRFLGTHEDVPLVDELAGRLRAEGLGARVESHCGRLELADSLRLLAHCGEFWGIDSALLHFARLFGLRCVSFWGPTSPAFLLKPFPIEEEVHYRGIACSPCVHVAESPPCAGRNLCMTSLLRPLTDEEQRTLLPVLRGS